MDGDIDLSGISEATLIEMFERMDPRYAPKNCARVKQALIELGYLISDDVAGPGTVTPGPMKLKLLTGGSKPFESEANIDWGRSGSRAGHGSGRIRTDGVTLEMWIDGLIAKLGRGEVIFCDRIVNVETSGNQVRVENRPDGETPHVVILTMPDERRAAELANILPRTRTADFAPGSSFVQTLRAGAGTWALIVANVVLYGLTAIASPARLGLL